MKIRQASPADMAAVGELSRQLAAHVNDPDPGVDSSLLLQCGFGPQRWFECLVAEEGNRIVGFAAFCRRSEALTREKRLWLGDLCIAQGRRRNGLGRALIAAVKARAVELGCTAIDLELARSNQIARAFYHSLHAVPCDQIEPQRFPT